MSSDYAYETSGPQWVDLREITNDSLSNDDFFYRTHDSLEACYGGQRIQVRKSVRLQNKNSSTLKSTEVNDSNKSPIQSAFIDDIDNICITPLKLKSSNINNKETCYEEYNVNNINDAMGSLKLASSLEKRPKFQNIDQSNCPKIEIIPDTPSRGKTPNKSLREVTSNNRNQTSNDQTSAKKIINIRRSVRNQKDDVTLKDMNIQDDKLTENLKTKMNKMNKDDIHLENKMTEELDNIKENIQTENIIINSKNVRASDCYSSMKNADTTSVKKKLRVCRSMPQNNINRTPVFNLRTSSCTMNLKQSKTHVHKLYCSDNEVSEIDENIDLENNETVLNPLQNKSSDNKPEQINSLESKEDDYNEEKFPNISEVDENQQINIPEIESYDDDNDNVETEFQSFDEFRKSLDEDENQYKVFKAQYTQKTLRNIQKTTVLAGQARRNSIQMKNILNHQRSNKYVSLAEGVKAFQRRTPTRFHTMKKNTEGIKKPKANQTTQQTFKRTIPVSPNWHSKLRTKKVVQDQGEEKQIKTKKVPTQKAHITSTCSKPQTEVLKKRITIPKPFKLSEPKKKTELFQSPPAKSLKTNKLASQKPHSYQVETHKILHSSIPVSRDFNISSKLEPKKTKTQPIPFQFEQRDKKALIEKEKKMKKLQDEKPKVNEKISSASVTKTSVKDAKNKHENGIKSNSHIKVMPFSFDKRDKLLAKKKEEMRKKMEEQEKKARVFHANPVPHFKPVQIKVPSRENSTVKRNMLRTKSADTFKSKDNLKERNVTRALSNDNFKHSGQQKSNKIISTQKTHASSSSLHLDDHNKGTDMPKLKLKLKPLNIELHSERRARLRREYEQKLKLQLEQEEARRRREQEFKLAKEREEIAKLRKQAEQKARPVPVYKPFVIAKSTRPITEPQSPAWAQSRR